MSYHPNYFNPEGAHRSDCEHRMNMIKETLSEAPSVIDVGCSGGYYSFAMRDKYNGYVFGIDTEDDLIEGCQKLAVDNDVDGVVFQRLELSDYLINEKERFNVALYMSAHHHVIARHGMKLANYLLKTLSNRCKVMYFDMGQKSENCPSTSWWNLLTACPDQKKWLVDYLFENTVYKKIEIIGSSKIHDTDRYFIRMSNEV